MVRRLARPLLASMFVAGGVDVLRDSGSRAEAARPVLGVVRRHSPVALPPDDLTLVRADAALKVCAGTLLALGRLQRTCSLALAASLLPTTVAGHRFWEVEDPLQRRNQQVHLLKNVSMLGGLLFAAVDSQGRRPPRRTRRVAGAAVRRARDTAGSVRDALPG